MKKAHVFDSCYACTCSLIMHIPVHSPTLTPSPPPLLTFSFVIALLLPRSLPPSLTVALTPCMHMHAFTCLCSHMVPYVLSSLHAKHVYMHPPTPCMLLPSLTLTLSCPLSYSGPLVTAPTFSLISALTLACPHLCPYIPLPSLMCTSSVLPSHAITIVDPCCQNTENSRELFFKN